MDIIILAVYIYLNSIIMIFANIKSLNPQESLQPYLKDIYDLPMDQNHLTYVPYVRNLSNIII